jgi:hypothetical protein
LNNFKNIQIKLKQFIQKYYVNELIKGMFLFLSIGLLYFIFTLLIEYFLWLKPLSRTILFILFIVVESALLLKFIVIPSVKIWGLKKGINEFEASKIIGNHFPEVSDKLLNVLQLRNIQENSELIEASIEQKSMQLQPIPFKRAIDFSKNKKYIKYALIPIVIWILVSITGNSAVFNDSFARVVHYKKHYEPPAPFSFQILNKNLDVIEGQPFTLQIETVGNIIPENVKIYFLNEFYYLESVGVGIFNYTFSNLTQPIDFYFEANGVISNKYQLQVLATPVISNLKMVLNYPGYTGKQNEVIENTGNAIVPQGTTITWQVETHQTEQVILNYEDEIIDFNSVTPNYFEYEKKLMSSLNYKINTTNKQLKNYESLQFLVQVVNDEFPKIVVQSNIDSVARSPIQFMGQISDDYGIQKLQLVYYKKNEPTQLKTRVLEFSNPLFSDFYYIFPDGIGIEQGVDYEFYFEVFDNDAVNGAKKTSSQLFRFYSKTDSELKEELLKEQRETLEAVSRSLENSKIENSELEKFQNELQKKATINWNDTNNLEEFLKRQQQYQELFQKQTNQLLENLNEQPEDKSLKEKKEELQKRIEETQKLAEQEKMMDELNKLTEKLSKEELVEKLKELGKKNKQNQQSLERILELTKRFYVEQKSNQIADKLKELAEKEQELSNSNESNTVEKQEELNTEFKEIRKDFKELNQQNMDLMRPMKLPENKEATEEISEEMNKALEQLQEQKPNEAKKSQKTASKKMQQLSKAMQQTIISANGEMIDENIEDLRKIVENLIEFSFQQEDVMENFSEADSNHPNFPSNLKEQYVLKEYFEHIDDSIYMLSLRLVNMQSTIQKDIADVHYNIDESLINFTENEFDQGISNQHFVITSTNNLANQLSDLLESLLNASPSMGSGKGNQPEFSLPDIIQKQSELTNDLEEGMKKAKEGEKNNENSGEGTSEDKEEMNGELYEIYKQQAQLKELLESLLKNSNSYENKGTAIKQMDELEEELLDKGFSKEVVKKMQQITYELLKLEKAKKLQGEDNERKAETNNQSFEKRQIDNLKLKNDYFNSNEILKRQSLPLRSIYKIKVQEYFKFEKRYDSI